MCRPLRFVVDERCRISEQTGSYGHIGGPLYGIRRLFTARLPPHRPSLGVSAIGLDAGDTYDEQVAYTDPLLAFKFRVGIIPEQTVWRIAGLFGPMFWPPVIIATLVGFVGIDLLIIAQGALVW